MKKHCKVTYSYFKSYPNEQNFKIWCLYCTHKNSRKDKENYLPNKYRYIGYSGCDSPYKALSTG